MPTSVVEQIALKLIERLERVVVYEDGQPTLAKVYRVNRLAEDWTPSNNAIVVMRPVVERYPESDCPGNPPAIAYQVTFEVKCFIRQDDRETLPDDAKVSELASLVQMEIAADANWHQFGGACFDSEFGEVTTFEPSESHAGAALEVLARYRVSETNPFEIRA